MNSELYNLVYSCLIDGCNESVPMTLEEAEYTISEWKAEGAEFADAEWLTAENLMKAWNTVLEENFR